METGQEDHLVSDLVKDCGVADSVEQFWRYIKISQNEVCKHFLQFVVDVLERDYVIKDADVNNIDEELVLNIFNSETSDAHSLRDTNCKQIVCDFLDHAFNYDLCQPLVESYQALLKGFIRCDEIPTNEVIVGQCYLLLSYLLEPLSDFYTRQSIDPLNAEVTMALIEYSNYVPNVLQSIIDLIPEGALFTEYGMEITLEFIHMVEKSPDVFVSKMGLLSKYAYFLSIDNDFILYQVAKSLNKLLKLLEVRESIRTFFFDTSFELCYDEHKMIISVKDMLHQIAILKGLTAINSEILQMFVNIADLDRKKKYFTRDERMDIYRSAINTQHDGAMRNLLRMMISNEGQLFPPLIEVMNAMKVSGINVRNIAFKCAQLETQKIEYLAFEIMKNIHCSKASIRACQIFKYFYEYGKVPEKEKIKILSKMHTTLDKCEQANDEIAYQTFVAFIIGVPRNVFYSELKRSPALKNGLVNGLLRAFRKFSFPKNLQSILTLIKIIKRFDIKLFKDRIKPILQELYDEYIEIDAMKIAELECTKDFENSLIKMTLLHETGLYSFTDFFQFDATIIINRNHLIDEKSRSFLLFARWQTTVLRLSFNFLLNKVTTNETPIFPCTLEMLMGYVCELRVKLMEMKVEVTNNYEAMILLTSIFELHHLFVSRPLMLEINQRVLHIKQPTMTVAQFKKLVDVMNSNIYSVEDKIGEFSYLDFKYNDASFSKKFIDSFTEFMKSYTQLPNYLPMFKFIHHYTNFEFHEQFHIILKFMQTKTEFAQIIGLCIMNFVITEEVDWKCNQFIAYLNRYLENEENTVIEISIFKFIFDNLHLLFKKLKPCENRMTILKFVSMMMPQFYESEAIELKDLIESVTSKLPNLNQQEAETIKEFIEMI